MSAVLQAVPPVIPPPTPVSISDPRLSAFLVQQTRECDRETPLDGGNWPIFVAESRDAFANQLAQTLLAGATFPHQTAASEDDRWVIYHVDEANRPAAMHWLADLHARVAGEIRPVAPIHRALVRQLAGSSMPHRVAMQLADLHAKGELTPGCINERSLIRMVLDRAHIPGNMILPALGTLLAHHLVDLVVLFEELLPEDIEIVDDLIKQDPPKDSVGRNRHEGAQEVHRTLTRFHLISPIDQEKNTAIANPYAAFVDVASKDERVVLPVDGAMVRLLREHVMAAIHATRRQLNAGKAFDQLKAMDSWVTDSMALPFRFLKQRLLARGDIDPMDWLYIVERAI